MNLWTENAWTPHSDFSIQLAPPGNLSVNLQAVTYSAICMPHYERLKYRRFFLNEAPGYITARQCGSEPYSSWLSEQKRNLADCKVSSKCVPTEQLHYRPASGDRKNSRRRRKLSCLHLTGTVICGALRRAQSTAVIRNKSVLCF
jgi:hypothetical protein